MISRIGITLYDPAECYIFIEKKFGAFLNENDVFIFFSKIQLIKKKEILTLYQCVELNSTFIGCNIKMI